MYERRPWSRHQRYIKHISLCTSKNLGHVSAGDAFLAFLTGVLVLRAQKAMLSRACLCISNLLPCHPPSLHSINSFITVCLASRIPSNCLFGRHSYRTTPWVSTLRRRQHTSQLRRIHPCTTLASSDCHSPEVIL